jgi:proline dehydrogenase
MEEAVRREALAQLADQCVGLFALGRADRRSVPFLAFEIVDRHEGRLAAHGQAHVAGLELAIDALAERGLDRNVSVKLSQMGLGVDAALCRTNVERILGRAAACEAFVRIDMEDHATTDATLAIWRELRPVNAGRGDSGVVVQAALRRSPADIEALIAEGARVRLCKGAYVEPSSVAYPDKADVDEAYGRLMERLLADGTFPAIATHDERLIRRAVDFVRERGIAPDRFEFQMLYGVRRDLQERLARAGFGVRVYVPYGTQWYPYFMRRLAERPANVAFVLRSVLREGRPAGDG